MKVLTGILVAASVVTLTGCGTSVSNPTKSAAVGAAVGAVAGKSTGDHSDRRAAKGAVLGALGGYVYGNEVQPRRHYRHGHRHY